MNTYNLAAPSRKKGFPFTYIVETLLILFALYCRIAVLPHDGSPIPILAFFAKLRDSFLEPYGIELAIGGAIFCLFYFIDVLDNKSRLRSRWPLIALSGVFAFLFVYCKSIRIMGNGSFIYANSYQLFLSATCITGHWILFHLVLRWVFFLLTSVKAKAEEGLNYRRMWLTTMLLMFVCWMPWLFSSYPSSFCSDSLNQLRQFFGIDPWTINHVPFSTLIMGLCVSLGALVKSRTFGVFLYIMMQSFIGAAVFSYLLVTLRKMGCGKRVYIAAFLFYAVFPLMPLYAQWFEKDFLYVCFFTLSMTLLISVLHEGQCSKKRAVYITLAVIMTSLLRNNGKFELLPFFILLCFVIGKQSRKALCTGLVSSLIVIVAVNNILYPSLEMVEIPAGESLSIPFQQTARYVQLLPEEVTEEEKAAIEAVLNYDNLAENYNPTLSDPVKNTYHGNDESLKEYFKVWLRMGLKHPTIYADAFVHQSYGYLAPVRTDSGALMTLVQPYYEDFDLLQLNRSADLIPTALLDTLCTIALNLPGLKLLASAGIYSWLIFTCIVFLLIKKRYRELLPLIPGFINFFVCLASALSSALRYDLQVVATMPLLLWWTAINLSEKNPKPTKENAE